MPFKVLVHHGYYTDWEITCNATTDLEKSYSFTGRIIPVPVSEPYHVFNTILYRRCFQFIFDHITGKDVSCSTVLPSRYYDRQIFFCCSYDPAIFWIDLVILFEITA